MAFQLQGSRYQRQQTFGKERIYHWATLDHGTWWPCVSQHSRESSTAMLTQHCPALDVNKKIQQKKVIWSKLVKTKSCHIMWECSGRSGPFAPCSSFAAVRPRSKLRLMRIWVMTYLPLQTSVLSTQFTIAGNTGSWPQSGPDLEEETQLMEFCFLAWKQTKPAPSFFSRIKPRLSTALRCHPRAVSAATNTGCPQPGTSWGLSAMGEHLAQGSWKVLASHAPGQRFLCHSCWSSDSTDICHVGTGDMPLIAALLRI